MKQKVIDKVLQDIEMNKLLIGFFEQTAKDSKATKDGKNKIEMKIEMLKKDIMFNEGFVAYANKQI